MMFFSCVCVCGGGGGVARTRKNMCNRCGEQRNNGRCWNKGKYVNEGSVLAVVMPLVVREGVVAWSRSATGAVTMTTRHFITFHSYILGCV